MRIVSLEPYLTQLTQQLGSADRLVGVTASCSLEEFGGTRPEIVAGDIATPSGDKFLDKLLSRLPVDFVALRAVQPDVVLTECVDDVILPGDAHGSQSGNCITLADLTQRLRGVLGNEKVQLVARRTRRLESIYELYEHIGVAVGQAGHGRERAQRLKAQLMDWADNFYDRTKNKRVCFLSSIEPFKLGGLWIPDLIALCSATSQERVPGEPARTVEWADIVDFKPDVIVVAPLTYDLKKSMATFKTLSKLPHWDEIPAVIRGEVVFCDGTEHFYNPVHGFIDSTAMLMSGIAGFESGYITDRDTFYRLRWLELHRHKL